MPSKGNHTKVNKQEYGENKGNDASGLGDNKSIASVCSRGMQTDPTSLEDCSSEVIEHDIMETETNVSSEQRTLLSTSSSCESVNIQELSEYFNTEVPSSALQKASDSGVATADNGSICSEPSYCHSPLSIVTEPPNPVAVNSFIPIYSSFMNTEITSYQGQQGQPDGMASAYATQQNNNPLMTFTPITIQNGNNSQELQPLRPLSLQNLLYTQSISPILRPTLYQNRDYNLRQPSPVWWGTTNTANYQFAQQARQSPRSPPYSTLPMLQAPHPATSAAQNSPLLQSGTPSNMGRVEDDGTRWPVLLPPQYTQYNMPMPMPPQQTFPISSISYIPQQGAQNAYASNAIQYAASPYLQIRSMPPFPAPQSLTQLQNTIQSLSEEVVKANAAGASIGINTGPVVPTQYSQSSVSNSYYGSYNYTAAPGVGDDLTRPAYNTDNYYSTPATSAFTAYNPYYSYPCPCAICNPHRAAIAYNPSNPSSTGEAENREDQSSSSRSKGDAPDNQE